MAYATREDMDSIFGCSNITSWADLENNGDADHIEERITWALNQATSDLNDKMHEGPYEFPLSSSPYPPSVVYHVALLAALHLYDSRGLRDADPGKDIMAPHRMKAKKWIHDVLSGQYKISQLTRITDVVTYPEVV